MKAPFFITVAVLFLLVSGCDGCESRIGQTSADTLPKTSTEYDVVVVGAGLSGLKTAADLADLKVLVLEKEPRIGGRIDRRKSNGISYDIGAVWGFLPMMTVDGATVARYLIANDDPVGFFLDGSYYLGNDLHAAMTPFLSAKQQNRLDAFINGGDAALDSLFSVLDDTQEEIVRSYFHRMHLGSMESYLPERQRDAFIEYPTKRFGLHHIVEQLGKSVEQITLNAEVTSVERRGEHVAVTYSRNGTEHTVSARSAVIATPADVTRKIVSGMNPAAHRFLDFIRYSELGVVVFVVKNDPKLPVFSTVATPGKPFECVSRTERNDGANIAYQVFYSGEYIRSNDTRDIFLTTRKHLDAMKLIPDGTESVLVRDFKFWKTLGTVITAEIGDTWSRAALEPLSGVFLAGDYTIWEDERTPDNKYSFMPKKMPYGVINAWRSGAKVAHYVRRYLKRRER